MFYTSSVLLNLVLFGALQRSERAEGLCPNLDGEGTERKEESGQILKGQ